MAKATLKAQAGIADGVGTSNLQALKRGPINTITGESSPPGSICLVSMAAKDIGFKKTNNPISMTIEDIGVVKNKEGSDLLYATDLGTFFVGVDIEDELTDGGPKAADGDPPSAGDLNPYTEIEKDGEKYLQVHQFNYDTKDLEAEAEYDINRVRGVALRYPFLMKGPAFDQFGNKLFEEVDRLDQDKWKIGPADWRFDCTRKVWVAAQSSNNLPPHLHLNSSNTVAGGGISVASFAPSEVADAESWKNICLT